MIGGSFPSKPKRFSENSIYSNKPKFDDLLCITVIIFIMIIKTTVPFQMNDEILCVCYIPKNIFFVHETSLFSRVSKSLQSISNYWVLRYIECLGGNSNTLWAESKNKFIRFFFKLLGLFYSHCTLYVCLSRNATQHDPRNYKFF